MADMKDYLRPEEIRGLCETIGLPDEVTGQALGFVENGACLPAAPHFGGLFSRDTSEESAKAISRQIEPGFGVMAALLAAALRTKEIYAEKGIAPHIFFDTMSAFKENVDENFALDGAYSFTGADWCRAHIAGIIYKLGVLEFDMLSADKQLAEICGLPEGERVLSVHIQMGAVMTRAALDESYRLARAFFPEYYPDWGAKMFLCSSWLLAPVLKTMLPEGSRILEFQKDYNVVNVREGDWYFPRIFNLRKKPEDCAGLPENTSLRRAVKRHILQGGTVGWATGLFPI
jgi:hypothetical protein